MLIDVNDAVRLTSQVLLRREQTLRIVDDVRLLVQTSKEAIEESRKLLAVNKALLEALRRPVEKPEAEPLTPSDLDEIATLVAKARGGYAFILNANSALPLFDRTPSQAIQ